MKLAMSENKICVALQNKKILEINMYLGMRLSELTNSADYKKLMCSFTLYFVFNKYLFHKYKTFMKCF